MPEESGSEISKLTLSVRPLISMPVEEAHRELTDAGIPYLDTESRNGQTEDLTSSNLDDMGSTTDTDYQLESKSYIEPTFLSNIGERPLDGSGTHLLTGEPQTHTNGATPSDQGQYGTISSDTRVNETEGSGATTGLSAPSGTSTGRKRKNSRPKHKEQWDRRLLSYVRKKNNESDEEQEDTSEHNLAVEAVARAAVSSYEKARGRVAEQMAQTHPGYDIISRNVLTGEERFIEVKGVNGEWNQTGVGLSRLQFSNAQDYGDRYWLYVVEFVSDPQHICVHPIRSPATQVTSFMFDGNWRDAVADERADPSLAFIDGATVNHQSFGVGRIASVEMRGATRLMSIDFETGGRRTVTLNLHTMIVVEEGDDDNNHS